jgi:hypothetical protein
MDQKPVAQTPIATPLVKKVDFKSGKLKEIIVPVIIILAIIGAGALSGYFLANRKVGPVSIGSAGGAEVAKGSKEVGVKDGNFKDTAEGRLEVNDGEVVAEGSHKLIRPGGQSQTAYLTSSIIDLNQFVGKCVQVWGETFAAQQAGWLMDVGRLKVLDSCPEGV